MSGNQYYDRLCAYKDKIVAVLIGKGIRHELLTFGGPGAEPKRKSPSISGERSDFSVHRPVGDWAEKLIVNTLSTAFPDWEVAAYGDTYAGRAGTAEFNELRQRQRLETRLYGKRPDFLIFPSSVTFAGDLCAQPCEATETIVKKAIAAAEVRSSKLEARKYMDARKAQLDAGKKVSRDAPSFTVKVEDLVVVYRWIERYRVPQSYLQVFFDSIFAMNFLEVFALIATGEGYTLDKHERSQGKPTIMIPITRGYEIARSSKLPNVFAKYHITGMGRYEAYLIAEGGEFAVDSDTTKKVLLGQS